MKIIPVILSGGSGTRLWPLSRRQYPKQFLQLLGSFSMFQETILRLKGLKNLSDPVVICNDDHRFLVAEQLNQIGINNAAIILEPAGRNTAPAIAAAAMHINNNDQIQNSIMLVLSADHEIRNNKEFIKTILLAKSYAQEEKLVTFGVTPDSPNTGYGYINFMDELSSNVYKVNKFEEKPDLITAESYIKEGNYLWNSGIFMFKASVILEELRKVIPSFLKRVDVKNRGIEWSNYLRDNQIQTENYVNENINKSLSNSLDVDLLEWEADAEKKIASYCLYSSSQKSLSDLKDVVSNLNNKEVSEILHRYTGHRKNRRHKPGRAFENSYYTFDVLSDYGAFRDLQRHRLMTIEWQKMSPDNGFDMPVEVEKSGLLNKCIKLIDDSVELHNKIKVLFPDLREYALLFGHKIRYTMTLNVRQAFHLIELRTAKQGHISYRDICQKMHNLIKEKAGHKIFYELMSYVDHENYELQRLDSEIKQSSKEKI